MGVAGLSRLDESPKPGAEMGARGILREGLCEGVGVGLTNVLLGVVWLYAERVDSMVGAGSCAEALMGTPPSLDENSRDDGELTVGEGCAEEAARPMLEGVEAEGVAGDEKPKLEAVDSTEVEEEGDENKYVPENRSWVQ